LSGLIRAYAKANGKKPLARVVAAAVAGVPPDIMGSGPAPAIRLLLARTGLKLSDIGRFEINEAQGAQTLAVGLELGLDLSLLNVNGGAIALGHPVLLGSERRNRCGVLGVRHRPSVCAGSVPSRPS
jgi:acetyl-CoA C-acetyltransferase